MKNRFAHIPQCFVFMLLGAIIYWLATMIHLADFDGYESVWPLISIVKGALLLSGIAIVICVFIYAIYRSIILKV